VRILAIDPGPEQSAYCVYDTETQTPMSWGKCDNLMALVHVNFADADRLAVEMVASYGMPVGAEVFATCVWAGRFIERWMPGDVRLVYRRDVKLHLCGDSRAKDANIRQAIIDRYGGKAKAIGLKATPGVLYGLSGDCWSALGVAITAAETEAS